jgi:hypothetical protein
LGAKAFPSASLRDFAFAPGRCIIAVRATQPEAAFLEATQTVVLLVLIVVLYLLPTLIAFGREHPQRTTVALLNIVLGWTLIGWIVVFVWALLVEGEGEPA